MEFIASSLDSLQNRWSADLPSTGSRGGDDTCGALARIPAFLHDPFTISLQCLRTGSGFPCGRKWTEGLPRLSGQSPLLRIGLTCAAIVVGSAIIGSQLSTGTPFRAVPTIAEDDEGTREDASYAGSVEGGVEDDSGHAAESIPDEATDQESEELAEVTDEEPAADEDESALESSASDPAAEDEPDDGESSWILGPSFDD
jgi:hypothetical protein